MVRTLIKRLCVAATVILAGLATGCSTMSNTEKGVGIGTAVGAGVGRVIGAATGNPKTGAVAGGLIGAGLGGLAGADADREERERKDAIRLAEAQAQQGPSGPLGLTDVVQMASGNPPVGDDVIINYIRQTNSTFQLSPTDIAYLKQNHVSDRVVNEMITGRSRVAIGGTPRMVVVQEPPPVVVYERPYYYRRPVYVMPPPPPIGVGVVIRR